MILKSARVESDKYEGVSGKIQICEMTLQ